MTSEIFPQWLANLCQDDCARLDVRPILAGGVDPLEQILAKVDQLAEQDILMIEAPFDPLPLRRMLGAKGYASHAVALSRRHWQVFFKKQERADLPQLPDFSDLPPFPHYWHEDVLEMDLRRLEPPNPMIAILKVIENGEGGNYFIARLIRDPIYLHPELVERNWHAEVIEENADGLSVKIIKGNKT